MTTSTLPLDLEPDAPSESAGPQTIAELLDELGGIDPARVLCQPPPGLATEADLLRKIEAEDQLVELIDGVLVEKPMGHRESRLAIWLAVELGIYLKQHPLGRVSGPDGPFRLRPRRVRLPDLAFVSFAQIPRETDLDAPIVNWVPELTIEVLSPGNTRREMDRKRKEYFTAGVQRVWELDPIQRVVRVYRNADAFDEYRDGDVIPGEPVLPGFRCAVTDWLDCP
jgi:Uma2 family endonuclease